MNLNLKLLLKLIIKDDYKRVGYIHRHRYIQRHNYSPFIDISYVGNIVINKNINLIIFNLFMYFVIHLLIKIVVKVNYKLP